MHLHKLSGQIMAAALTILIVAACAPAVQATPSASPATPTVTLTEVPTKTAAPSSTSTPIVTGWDYVALGDSNPGGFGVTQPYVKIYGNYIAKDLGVEVRVHNWAFNGAKTASLLAKLGTNTELQQDIREAEVVTIDIGANDWTSVLHTYPAHKCGGTDNQDCLRRLIQSYKENLDAVLNEIAKLHGKDSKPLIRIVDLYMSNCDYPNIYGTSGIFKDIKPYLDQFNADIAQAARVHDGLVVPLYLTMNGRTGDQNPLEYIQNDQCHLNPNGHRTVADMLRELGYEN
jgi:lysophospholipase L1-like esterase